MANLGYIWGKYEQDVISFKEHWYLLTFAYKWIGDKTVKAYSLKDFKGYDKNKTDDRELCLKLWELFDEADIVIAHNGDQFDIKKAQARFVQHGFKPPTPFKSIDTKKVAKAYFKFDSNKLDDLGQYLHLGKKLNTGGFELWLGCAMNDPKAWHKMIEYNKQDVALLEKVYLALRPWMTNHPNLDLRPVCANCGGFRQSRGYKVTRTAKYRRLQCQECGAWSYGERIK